VWEDNLLPLVLVLDVHLSVPCPSDDQDPHSQPEPHVVPLIHPFLWVELRFYCSSFPPFSSYGNSPKKYSSTLRQSSTSKDPIPSPLELPRFSSCRITLPSYLLSPCLSPRSSLEQPQGYTVMISLSWLSTFETTHVDNAIIKSYP